MPFDFRFPNGEILRGLPDDTPPQFLAQLHKEFENWGSLGAVSQRQQVLGLREDEEFLALPTIERHRVFNEMAKDGLWWNQIDTVGRRLIRADVVDRAGANEEQAYNYWESPIRWKDQEQDPEGGPLAEFGNALERSAPKVASYFMRALPTAIDAIVPAVAGGYLDYIAPLVGVSPEMREGAKGQVAQATGNLAQRAREVATDISVGAELLAPPPKIGTFGEVHGWDDFTMYFAQALGTQTPIVGSIALAAAVPVVGTGLAFGAGMGLETGVISEDLQKEGYTGHEANVIATNYGALAGALEAAPVVHLLKGNPVIAKGLRNFISRRLISGGLQAVEEAGTEGLQTLLETAAIDFAHQEKGELEKLAWTTPEGRRNLWEEVQEAMIQGALIGGTMGVGMGHAALEKAQEEAADEVTAAETDLVPEGDRGPRVPGFVPTTPTEEGMLEVEDDFTSIPTEIVEPVGEPAVEGPPVGEFVETEPIEQYEPTEEDLQELGPGEIPGEAPAPKPLEAKPLAKSETREGVLRHREAEAEKTASDWFSPLGASDGTGWLVYNPEGIEKSGSDQIVFATGEIETRSGEDGMIVRDQDGNTGWFPITNAAGDPNFFVTRNETGEQYLQQRSAANSQGRRDILTAPEGQNHSYNLAGASRRDEIDALSDKAQEAYDGQMQIWEEHQLAVEALLQGGRIDVWDENGDVIEELRDVPPRYRERGGEKWDNALKYLADSGLGGMPEEGGVTRTDANVVGEILGRKILKPNLSKIRKELVTPAKEAQAGVFVPPGEMVEPARFARERAAFIRVGQTIALENGDEVKITKVKSTRQGRRFFDYKHKNGKKGGFQAGARQYVTVVTEPVVKAEPKPAPAPAPVARTLTDEEIAAQKAERQKPKPAPVAKERDREKVQSAADQQGALHAAGLALETMRRNIATEAAETGKKEADLYAEKKEELDRLEREVAKAREPFEIEKKKDETEAEAEERKKRTKLLVDILVEAKDEAFPLAEAEALVDIEEKIAFEFTPSLTVETAERIATKRTKKRKENLPLFEEQVDEVSTDDIIEQFNKHTVKMDAFQASMAASAATFRKAIKERLPGSIYEALLKRRYAGGLPTTPTNSASYWHREAKESFEGEELSKLEAKAEAAAKKAKDRWNQQAQEHLFETRVEDVDLAAIPTTPDIDLAAGRASLAHAKRMFKGWKVEGKKDGFAVSRPGLPPIRVYFVKDLAGQISTAKLQNMAKGYDISPEEFASSIKAGKVLVRGMYSYDALGGAHTIALSNPGSSPQTLYHEAFHFAYRNLLTKAERVTLDKEFNNEEGAARAFGTLADAQFKAEGAKTQGGRVLRKIYDWALDMLKVAGIKQSDGVSIMKKITDGEVWKRAHMGVLIDASGEVRTQPVKGVPQEVQAFAGEITSAAEFDNEAAMKKRLSPEAADKAIKKAAGIVPATTTVPSQDLGAPVVRIRDHVTMFELEFVGDGETEPRGAQIAPETLAEWNRDKVIRRLFAKLEPLKRFQEELTSEGVKIADGLNAWLRARNFTSRAGHLIDWLEKNLYDPLIDEIASLGIEYQDFETFLMARHSLEANPLLYKMHVVTPKHAANEELKRLKKTGLRRNNIVLVPGKENQTGTIKKIVSGERELRESEHGQQVVGGEIRPTVEIEWTDNVTGETILEEFDLSDVQRRAVVEQENIIAEIDKMVAEDNVPHAGLNSDDARDILLDHREAGWIEFKGDKPTNKTVYTGKFSKADALQKKIVHWKENLLVSSGLLSPKELARWRKDYKHYTPMRGRAPDINDAIYGGERPPLPDIEDFGGTPWLRAVDRMAKAAGYKGEIYQPNIGRGYSPGKRSAMRRRLGRHSMPTHSTLVELMTDGRELAIRAERNRVAKTVWNLFNQLKNIKGSDGELLFEIDTKPKKRIYDEKTGKIRYVTDDQAYRRAAIYDVWIDGEHHFIRAISVDMAGLMSTLNSVGPADVVQILRSGAAVNRYISKMATSRNPAFAIPNVVRDFLTAGIRLKTEYQDLGVKILKGVPAAFNLVRKYNRDSKSLSAKDRARVEKWKSAGGETAYWIIPNFETQTKNLAKKIKHAGGGQNVVIEKGKWVIKFLEDYNGALEAAARFVAFEAAIANGATNDQAALVSREITVDFNQQGEWAGNLGAFYVFANASLQGSRMVYQTLGKTKKGRRWLAALFALGFTQAVIGRFAGGDDPDDGVPYWEKKSPYEKSRNLNIMIPGTEGKSMKIPLPWGFNVPFMAGAMVADVIAPRVFGMSGKGITAGEATVNIMSSAASAFNPIGDGDLTTPQGWQQMLAPSWFDTAHDIIINRTFWGGPIAPSRTAYKKSEQYGKHSPDFERYFSSVSAFSREATKALAKWPGIDISPENVDYAIAGAFGGLGDTINKFASAPFTLAKNKRLAAHEMPILRSFYADESAFYAPQMYRANMGDHYLAWETYRELEKENPAAADAYYVQNFEIIEIHDLVTEVEDIISELKGAGVNISDSRQQRVFKRFNRMYDRAEQAQLRRLKKKK